MTKEQFDFTVNVTQTLIWQYNDASKLQAIIEDKQAWLDANLRDFWANWYRDVFDLRTANDFGLQIWAVILGMKFTLAADVPTLIFGFDGSGLLNFNNSVFRPSGADVLTTEQKRLILRLRYRFLTSNATIDEVQRAVGSIFPGATVLDKLDMTAGILVSPTVPDSFTTYVLDNYDVVPRPNSVQFTRRFGWANWFAFDGAGGQNFNNSTFGA